MFEKKKKKTHETYSKFAFHLISFAFISSFFQEAISKELPVAVKLLFFFLCCDPSLHALTSILAFSQSRCNELQQFLKIQEAARCTLFQMFATIVSASSSKVSFNSAKSVSLLRSVRILSKI